MLVIDSLIIILALGLLIVGAALREKSKDVARSDGSKGEKARVHRSMTIVLVIGVVLLIIGLLFAGFL